MEKPAKNEMYPERMGNGLPGETNPKQNVSRKKANDLAGETSQKQNVSRKKS